VRHMPRRAVATVALLALTLVTAPFVARADETSCGGRIKTTSGPLFEWMSIDAPRFSVGGRDLVSYAVDPSNGDHLYATNGTVVAVSRDGGCKWKETYTFDLPVGGEIRKIVAPAVDRAALAVATPVGPSVVVTDDKGATWSTGGTGLPPQGDPETFVAVRTIPGGLFMGIDFGGGALDALYASVDGGQTWLLRSDLSDARVNGGIDGISIDDMNPQSLWAWGTGGLYHSKNGGAAFTPVNEFNGKPTVNTVARGGSVMTFLPESRPRPKSSVSKNNGNTWLFNPSPGKVTSADHGPEQDSIVISAAGLAYIYNPNLFIWHDLEAPNPGFTDVRFHTGGGLSIFGRTARTIERSVDAPPVGCLLRNDCRLPIFIGPNVSLRQPPGETRKETRLGPDGRRVVLTPGESKTVPYRLRMPETPVPLDVYFLVDTSSSMTQTLKGLGHSLGGIVNGLHERRIDVKFGLAEFRAYPSKGPADTSEEKNYVYKQIAQIPASLGDLEEAIEGLAPEAGGHYDAHIEALYQTATGDGVDVFPVGVSNEHDVPRGLQADFRDKAVRVVIHASDESFKSNKDADSVDPRNAGDAPPPDIRPVGEVIDALNAQEIKHVGLSIGKEPREDLKKVSQRTDTLATGPVDCDANGTTDLQTGDPLVCLLRSTQSNKAFNLVPPVVGLLRAVQEQTKVSLEARKGEAVVRQISPRVHEGVVLQTDDDLEFDVTYRCSRSQAGNWFPVRLQAVANIPLNAAVDARVVCKDEPADPDLPVSSLAPLVAFLVPPPPPPPPAPVSQLNPATQSQSQAQAQAAAAHQEQEEKQLAYVASFDEAQFSEETELAMSVYRSHREVPAEAFLGMGAVAAGMMLAAAVALRRRHQIRLALQRRV
jgi:hypothetical protein